MTTGSWSVRVAGGALGFTTTCCDDAPGDDGCAAHEAPWEPAVDGVP